ncbi:hypothetical protein EDD86DRAFT_188659 [Gorgonomyces haynaldii]|nr:hypothetical protein EDD86DRAFT_188659 [Gorgonomyces haynaldii]
MNGQSFTNDSIFLEGIPELHQISQLEHIPRPRNAFIIYRHHQSILFQDAPMTNQQKSKEIAKLWKSELESVREIYHQMAEEEKQMHAEIYPHYQFRRRRKQ